MNYAISAGMLFLESLCEIFLCDAYMQRRLQGYRFYAIFLGQGLLDLFVLNCNLFSLGSTVKAIFVVCLLSLGMLAVYREPYGKCLFFTALYYILLNLVDYCLLFVSARITGRTIADMHESGATAFIAMGLTGRFLFFVAIYCVNRVRHSRQRRIDLAWTYWLGVLVIPLYGIINFSITLSNTAQMQGNITYALFEEFGMLAVQLILLYQLDRVVIQKEDHIQLQALQKEASLRMENINHLVTAYAEQRKLSHDYNNHLSVLSDLLHGGKTAEAEGYLNALSVQQSSLLIVDTCDPVINAVLNEKYAKARSCGVTLLFKLNDLRDIRMERRELVTVLANLLDNAIEAAAKTAPEKAVILKFISYPTGKAVLSVRNTSTPVQITDGQLATGKSDSLAHGYGLRNIKLVLEQNHCPYDFSWQGGWFTFVAELPCGTSNEGLVQ